MKKTPIPRIDVSKILLGVNRPPDDFPPDDGCPDEWDSPEYLQTMRTGHSLMAKYSGPLEKAYEATGMDTPLLDRVMLIESILNAEFEKDPPPHEGTGLTPKQAQIVYILRFVEELKLDLSGQVLGGNPGREVGPSYNERTVSNALNVGAMLMRLAGGEQLPELFRMMNQQGRHIQEIPKKAAIEVRKRSAKRAVPGKPPRYTKNKMDQAFTRMHGKINTTGMNQLKAAEQVIRSMGLTIGAPYLVQQYRIWLQARPRKKTH